MNQWFDDFFKYQSLRQQAVQIDEMRRLRQIAEAENESREAERDRIRALPQCPHCGGRLEGGFGKCGRCQSAVSWVEDIPCKPGHENEVREMLHRQRQAIKKRRAALELATRGTLNQCPRCDRRRPGTTEEVKDSLEYASSWAQSMTEHRLCPECQFERAKVWKNAKVAAVVVVPIWIFAAILFITNLPQSRLAPPANVDRRNAGIVIPVPAQLPIAEKPAEEPLRAEFRTYFERADATQKEMAETYEKRIANLTIEIGNAQPLPVKKWELTQELNLVRVKLASSKNSNAIAYLRAQPAIGDLCALQNAKVAAIHDGESVIASMADGRAVRFTSVDAKSLTLRVGESVDEGAVWQVVSVDEKPSPAIRDSLGVSRLIVMQPVEKVELEKFRAMYQATKKTTDP